MIKFFRKIRQQLLTENKFSKYLLYAIGEIILVVIGILIALQINTWNQNRLQRNEEKIILKNIHDEFILNKAALQRTIQINRHAYEANYILMDLIGKNRNTLISVNTDSLLYEALYFKKFNPSENAILDIIQSGKLRILHNEKVKELIYQWSPLMKESYKNYDTFESKIQNELVPYITEYYPFKDIDYYGSLKYKSKSILKNDKFKIFYDIKFESLIDDSLWRLDQYMKDLKNVEILIDKFIEETRY
jgi:hypothetical protein